jgi:hypothetical protein
MREAHALCNALKKYCASTVPLEVKQAVAADRANAINIHTVLCYKVDDVLRAGGQAEAQH